MTGKYTAKITYIGDLYYSSYKWKATVYLDEVEVASEATDWRWWAKIWLHFAAISHRRQERAKKRDRAKGDSEYEL